MRAEIIRLHASSTMGTISVDAMGITLSILGSVPIGALLGGAILGSA